MPLIIDTDPGIDDAIAILYALRPGAPKVAALCTVAGNIGLDVTTRNAGRIAALAGVAVPVHPGAAAPLGREGRPELAIHGSDGLGGVVLPEPTSPPDPCPAPEAMARILRAHPVGDVTLLCLGPLTNLALLLRQDPEAAARLGRVIAMGGVIHEPGNMGPRAEFNIAQDPEAAAAVLAAGFDLTLIPLDATRQWRADPAYLERLRATGARPAQVVADLLAAYVGPGGRASRPLHDPCVPLLAAHPELFDLQDMTLDVALEDGALVPGRWPLRVAMGLRAQALGDVLAKALSGAAAP